MSTHFSIKIEQFRVAMLSEGILPPFEIQLDGLIHRFHVDGDKHKSKNGWYVFYDDLIACGVFGSWKTGASIVWCSQQSQKMNFQERAVFEKKVIEAKHKLRLEREKVQKLAAVKANRIYFKSSTVNPNHPYLIRKRVGSFCARKDHHNIVLPIVDLKGKIWSLQYIAPNGDKWFLKEGLIAEHFIPVQKYALGARYLVCEGFATAATLAECYPEHSVIAACNAGNLKLVTVGLRKHFPKSEIIVCADDDRLSSTNIGIIKGREAAIAAQAFFTSPEWPKGAPQELSDFNDLACWKSLQWESIA